MKTTTKITLDTQNADKLVRVIAKQGDQGSRYISITVTENGKPFGVNTDMQARIRCLRKDGAPITTDAEIQTGGTILARIPDEVMALPGVVLADITLFDQEGTFLSTLVFTIQVKDAPLGSSPAPDPRDVDALLIALAKLDATIAKTELVRKLVENIPTDYQDLILDVADLKEDLTQLDGAVYYKHKSVNLADTAADNKKLATSSGKFAGSAAYIGLIVELDTSINSIVTFEKSKTSKFRVLFAATPPANGVAYIPTTPMFSSAFDSYTKLTIDLSEQGFRGRIYAYFMYFDSAKDTDIASVRDSIKIYYGDTYYEAPVSYINLLDGRVTALENAKAPASDTTVGMCYSWWTTHTAVDAYGNLYFGYITKDKWCGVCMRSASGRIMRRDLWRSNASDDHNQPGVALLDDGRVLVVGTSGHNADGKIHVMRSDAPYSIDSFTAHDFALSDPSGYTLRNSYSQLYTNGNNVYCIFRCRQTGDVSRWLWLCAKSGNSGDSWSVYRLLQSNQQDYIRTADVVGSKTLKRIVTSRNPKSTPLVSINMGFVDLSSGMIYDGNMQQVSTMQLLQAGEIPYVSPDGFYNLTNLTAIVNRAQYRSRLLDVAVTPVNEYAVLWANAKDSTFTDFDYHYNHNGADVIIGNSGMPFLFYNSYISGAVFAGRIDRVVYAKCDANNGDGYHSLHSVIISDDAVASESIIKESNQCIIRPVCYDGTSLIYEAGRYNDTSTIDSEGSFTEWTTSIAFSD